MLKETLRSIDIGILPEIGLIAFFIAFVLILARVMMMSREQRERAKNLPLQDDDEIISHERENGS